MCQKKLTIWTFCLVLFIFPFSIQGQKSDIGIDLRYKIGFLTIHHASMAHLPRSLAQAVEFSYFKHTGGKQGYQKAYDYPTFGATLFHGSVGNTELLGRYTGIYGFSELPIIKYKSFETNLKLATGFAYSTKCFQNSPQNIAIGSYINGIICIGVKSLFRVKNQHLSLGIDMTHFSNAAVKLPNYGINIPYFSIGYGRNLPQKKLVDTMNLNQPVFNRNQWLITTMGIYGSKEYNDIGGQQHNVFGLNLSAKRFFNFKSGLEFALDVISKQAIHAYLPEIKKTQADIIQVGLYSAYLMPLSRFHFVFGMGVYVRDKYKPEDPVYHRIGCRYQFPCGLIGNFTLKTHYGRADYLELGLGYTFKTKRDE